MVLIILLQMVHATAEVSWTAGSWDSETSWTLGDLSGSNGSGRRLWRW